jgi:gliding motility-associated protein GldL
LQKSTSQGEKYSEQMFKTGQNLEALNAVYELQLKAADSQYQATNNAKIAIESLVENVNESVNGTQQYKDQMASLTRNIAALNSVYGNMLTAMNFNAGR